MPSRPLTVAGGTDVSPASRILNLQKQIEAQRELWVQKQLDDISSLVDALMEGKAFELKPGIRDEFDRLTDHLRAVKDRCDAIRSRG